MTEIQLRTPGVMAAALGVPLRRVQHILNTRLYIQAAARAGTLRLYDAEAFAAVQRELRAQDRRREQRGGGR